MRIPYAIMTMDTKLRDVVAHVDHKCGAHF